MDFAHEDLQALLSALVLLALKLPVRPLTPRQRRALGGLLDDGTPRVVRAVAAALTQHPELFTDQPVTGPDLARRQARASAWLRVCSYLRALLAIAQDHYLAEQAQAARDANAVLHDVKAEEQVAAIAATDRHADRVAALALALDYDQDRPRSRGQRRRLRELRAEKAAPSRRRAGEEDLIAAGLRAFLARFLK